LQRTGSRKHDAAAFTEEDNSIGQRFISVSFFNRRGQLVVADLVFPLDEINSSFKNSAMRCHQGSVRVVWQSRSEASCGSVQEGLHQDSQPKNYRRGSVPAIAKANKQKNLAVAVEADAEFVSALGGRKKALRAIKAAVHGAGALYMRQLGLALRIKSRHAFLDAGTEPLRSTDAESLLEEFRNYTAKHHQLRGDAKMLFTGKDLTISGANGVAGLAYTGVVCSRPRYSFGLVERANKALETVLVAHELGHLLGAQHSNQSGSIMYPIAMGSHESFAPESVEEIRGQIDAYPACLRR
jgi:predicted Zn-dependent protease